MACCIDNAPVLSGPVSCNPLQVIDPAILKQYIFQKGFITESAKLKREQEAASATLQVGHAGRQADCRPLTVRSLCWLCRIVRGQRRQPQVMLPVSRMQHCPLFLVRAWCAWLGVPVLEANKV